MSNHVTTPEEIITTAKSLCIKFIDKAQSGRARSVETFAECTALLDLIEQYENRYENKFAEDLKNKVNDLASGRKQKRVLHGNLKFGD